MYISLTKQSIRETIQSQRQITQKSVLHQCLIRVHATRMHAAAQLLVLIFDAQLTVKPYKPTATLMGGQQSSEHHMHRLLIQPTNRHLGSRHFCRVLFLKSHWPVYDAVEIALNPAALIKKKKLRVKILNFQMAQGAKFTAD